MHPHPAVQVSFEVDDKRRVLRLLHFVMRCVQIIKPALISDGHKDAGWLKQLKQFLALLEDRDLIRGKRHLRAVLTADPRVGLAIA